MANIVLNTKTYNGRGVANGIATYMETSAGFLAGFSPVTGSILLPAGRDAKGHVKWRLSLPVMAEEASACACPGEEIDLIDAFIQVRASRGVSATVRTDFGLRLKDLVALPEFQASIASLSQPTG